MACFLMNQLNLGETFVGQASQSNMKVRGSSFTTRFVVTIPDAKPMNLLLLDERFQLLTQGRGLWLLPGEIF